LASQLQRTSPFDMETIATIAAFLVILLIFGCAMDAARRK
jgi:hypothetical protein